MSDEIFPTPDEPVDRLVRHIRDSEARAYDVDHFLNRLHTVKPRRRVMPWVFTVAGALAASTLLALFLMVPSDKVAHAASPTEVVEQAKAAHLVQMEQVYRVTHRWIPGGRKKLFVPEMEWESLLYTRGDRLFLVRGDGKPGAWGRDERGRTWAVINPRTAIAFEREETPEPLKDYMDIRSMEPEKLLDSFLKTCDLTWGEEPESPETKRQIVITPKSDADTNLKWAKLSIRQDQPLIERLQIERKLRFNETVQITFERVDRPLPDPAKYMPEAHLEAGGKLWDQTRPLIRMNLFREWMATGPK